MRKRLRRAKTKFLNSVISKNLKNQHFYSSSEVQKNDIVIAGFPKSGNTWMQNLVAGAIYGIDTAYLPDRLTHELVPSVKKGYYKRILEFTCFKCHEVPQQEYRKVIHLVRDGRDAMASYYHFRQGLGFDESYEDHIIHGKNVYPCKWHEHTKQWIENPYGAEILTMKYEDLLVQPLEEMKRFCNFAGIERDNELLQRSIDGNAFKKMQAKEQKFKRQTNLWKGDKKFFRKGKKGSYKEEIPAELIKYFENESYDQLKHFGYDV